MKLGVVMSSDFKDCEAPSFEPLSEAMEVTGFASRGSAAAGRRASFPVETFWTPEELVADRLGPAGLPLRYLLSRTGWNHRLVGASDALARQDVLHAKGITTGYTLQCVEAKRTGTDVQVVVTVYQNIPFHRPAKWGVSGGNAGHRKRVLEETDAFVAVTGRAALALRAEGVPEERIHEIPFGVDLERFRPGEPDPALAEELGVDGEGVDLFYVGRLQWRKGVDHLLWAFADLCGRLGDGDPRVRLHFVGDGPRLGRLRRWSGELGVEDRVRLHGRRAYREMPDVHRTADVLVAPSIPTELWQEQFGFVAVEAMASGTALVVGESGSFPEVVGDAGLLVQPADVVDLSRALERLVGDGELREELGRRGRERAEERFGHRAAAERHARLYRSL